MTGSKPRIVHPLAWPFLMTFLVMVLAAVSPVQAAKPVILDTDLCDDIDDTWAIGLLLQCPELEPKMIVSEVGNTEAKAKVIAKYLDKCGRTDIAVGIGVKQHNRGHRHTEWAKDYKLASYPGKVHEDGVQAMIDIIMNSPQRVTLIAVGPVPNVAEALKREPRIAEKAEFIGMHGSIYKGYGGSDKVSPEYNVRADVKACQKVFTADWDMTITPLDTCGLVVLDGEKYQKVFNRNSAVTSNLLANYRIWQKNGMRNQYKEADEANLNRLANNVLHTRSSTLFDTVAIYLAVSHDLVKMEKLPIEVDDQGYTRIVQGAKMVDCAVDWTSLDDYETWLVDRLTK